MKNEEEFRLGLLEILNRHQASILDILGALAWIDKKGGYKSGKNLEAQLAGCGVAGRAGYSVGASQLVDNPEN